MVVNYFETGYKFIDNVRFFKANDPYFYKVDNIPLKELAENDKFLKDQVDGLISQVSQKPNLGRDGFSELQPYTDQVDSIVKVKPGRFSARINDAYSIEPNQFVTQVLGLEPKTTLDTNTWRFQTVNGVNLAELLGKFKTKTAANATNMNGLFERAFVFPMDKKDQPGEYTDTADPGTFDTGDINTTSPYPGYTGTIPLHSLGITERELKAYYKDSITGFRNNGRLESEFIRVWKGVTRTSIVDVPNELEIEIPPFEEDDFFYINETGEKVAVNSTQRIDLLFIYTKAVDQGEAAIASYTNGSPKTITAPTLGIVKGAGVGVNLKEGTGILNRDDRASIQSIEGTPLMIPNVADELADNTGFETSAGTIKGSFPSPDDLMNLAPLLSEQLSSSATPLIGQTVLPVAYIVVKNTASLGATGKAIITNDDIIDIRPLMRTTELAYNERAGIAAANPQLSIANPVVTEDFIEEVRTDIINDYNIKINNLANAGNSNTSTRIIGAGTVKGGMYYGVEGALASYIKDVFNVTEYEQAKTQVAARFGYIAGTIPDLPDWDIAIWCRDGGYSGKGQLPNDRINYHQFGMQIEPGIASTGLTFGPFRNTPATIGGTTPVFDSNTNPRISALGTDELPSVGNNVNNIGNNKGANIQYFVSKTIQIDRSQIQWATDYDVHVQLLNCVPMSCRTGMNMDGNKHTQTAATSNVWVEKKADSFTIFVSWVADDPLKSGFLGSHPVYKNTEIPPNNRNNGEKYAGFSVINTDIMNTSYANSTTTAPSTNAGVAIYPTVAFQVVGISQDMVEATANLNTANPTLILQ